MERLIKIENVGLSVGGIIGIIIGSIAFVAIITIIIIYCKKRRTNLYLGSVAPNANDSLPYSQPSTPTCEPPVEPSIDFKEPLYPSSWTN